MKNYQYILILSAFFQSCGNIERVDNQQIRDEIKNRQVKQISSQQFTNITQVWGKDFAKGIIDEMNQKLNSKNANIAELCQFKGLTKTDSVQKAYRLGLRILSRKDLTSKDLKQKEFEVLDAFAYNAENKIEPTENVQKLNDSLMYYAVQLPYNSAICKACIANDPTNLAVLGIIIPKKVIIRKITVKELKKIGVK
jgi:hypothetical protein